MSWDGSPISGMTDVYQALLTSSSDYRRVDSADSETSLRSITISLYFLNFLKASRLAEGCQANARDGALRDPRCVTGAW